MVPPRTGDSLSLSLSRKIVASPVTDDRYSDLVRSFEAPNAWSTSLFVKKVSRVCG